ncbi:hypothetical protein ABIF65_000088 [Bradyrhizobium japonicum]|uniref:Uncharacterized protein n=2 Tax=Bradyrhizobium TaxID=374 RepID=A0A809WY57_9BRAD|nr:MULTISPECIES: hypothetical protein [Bradyrhizobium]TWI59531.1 hypothetical protein IQ16_07986 [Bradyrhizobium huanghuaihaiense]WLB95684.1 hypothetical protein QIH92_39385 [Bradyrhizobium japonicum USDA 123]MCP1738618.1 hypothetical protein [Bradyrhizobium japonicum]MCW2320075.1 hypothetical protein [Bradyrhizobium japonicum]WLA72378.1 hypothetical protein QIH77_36700 [Bradyrhizobium diazoefficiens]
MALPIKLSLLFLKLQLALKFAVGRLLELKTLLLKLQLLHLNLLPLKLQLLKVAHRV